MDKEWEKTALEFIKSSDRKRSIRQHGEEKGRLLFALEEAILAEDEGTQLSAEDVRALAEAARRFIGGRDRYLGEHAGLIQARIGTADKFKREMAIQELIKVRMKGGENSKLDNETYEAVAKKYDMSRSTLQREVKDRRQEKMVYSVDGNVMLATLDNLLNYRKKMLKKAINKEN
ncbi:hypothetical protein [Vreelandella alkaliphila]|uniref:Uncharacterized protein n=1 Tax=Vreelandella alkaliphila TaxID=272774 RepID=A0AAJ2VNT8_9GAMM|nr:hypothetical protein [Halomonas alkaliphila]MDX5976019.1 hypothetical protein [Halomonas alkaliphila]